MEIKVNIDFGDIPPPTPKLTRTLIKWDSSVALADGYGTPNRLVNGQLIGQFCMCPVYLTDQAGNWVKSWAENSLATRLTPADLLKIASLQIADTYSVSQKMGWLCAAPPDSDGWGSPINTLSQDWQTATSVRMITAVYAGQPVELTGETMVRPIDLSGNKNFEKLWRVQTYYPSQWTRENAQLVTAVSAANNYTEFTKGKIVLPVYFGDRQAWCLDRWLA